MTLFQRLATIFVIVAELLQLPLKAAEVATRAVHGPVKGSAFVNQHLPCKMHGLRSDGVFAKLVKAFRRAWFQRDVEEGPRRSLGHQSEN